MAGIFPGKDPAGKTGHLDGIPVSAENLGEIPARSRYLFYKGTNINLAGIPARFSPGSKNPGGQNLAGILPRIPPRFSPRRKIPGGQNLGAILPRILPRFSPGSNNPGGQNLAKCYRESRQDSRRGANSRWQKSRRDLAGNLAKIGTAKVAKKAFNVGRSGTQYVAMVTELLSSY